VNYRLSYNNNKNDKSNIPNVPNGGDTGSNDSNGEISIIDNHIYFYDDVNRKTILELNKLLRKITGDIIKTKNDFGFSGGEINLHIMSYGGDLMGSFGIMDYIKSSPISINTYIDGYAASAATVLSIVGDKRYMTKNSFMLIHELSSGFWGKYSDSKDNVKNLDKMMAMLTNIYTEHTRIPKKKINEILKHDIWLTPDECLSYGLVDIII